MKYKLTDETKEFCGKTLFRIEATRDIPKYGIQSGDLGGWVENERNLLHGGDAWVGGDARVYGDAWVGGDAQVYGDARVYGDAWVYGDARVYGDAWVGGDARIKNNGNIESTRDYCVFGPCGSRDDFTTFYKTETGIWVSCGCFNGSISYFLEKVEETHGDNKHGRIYKALAELASMKLGGEDSGKCD